MNKQRYYGIDIVRFLSVIAISHFHMHESLIYLDSYAYEPYKSLNSFLSIYSHFFSFSGYTIVSLSALLIGRSYLDSDKFKKLILVLWLGAFCLAFLYGDEYSIFVFEWDIYNYLLITLTVLFFLRNSLSALIALSLVFIPLFAFPIWTWFEPLIKNNFFKDMLIGDCSTVGHGAWPVFPWLGLPLIFFTLGKLSQLSPWKERLQTFKKPEALIWITLALLFAPYYGGFYKVPVGPGFACFMHRQPPLVFLSHMFLVVWALRLSFSQSINLYLGKYKLVRGISSLYWSRHFALCYAVEFLWLWVGSNFSELIFSRLLYADIYLILLLPAVEILSRTVHYLFLFFSSRISASS